MAVFVPYYINIWKGIAKPHLFSWLMWGILTGLGFILSLRGGGGEGSWVFALQSILCLGVAGYAFVKGEKNITRIDWIFFVSAIAAMFIYAFTKNAVLSVSLAATVDFLGFLPTFRKSYSKPYEEPALTYFFSFLSFLFSLGALRAYSFVTLFYPLTLVATNGIFVMFLLVRRKSVR
ncbi:MAG: hypothetical protein Q7K28_00525 [Candidatus Wildermuthbacteria bacterium]|nr:hypothetical protein [Candidatus Wildermuthbacteria bacterium]